jgi:hypothetical protein
MHGLNYAVVRQLTFSLRKDGKVFLCLKTVEPVRPVKPVAMSLQRANGRNGHNVHR